MAGWEFAPLRNFLPNNPALPVSFRRPPQRNHHQPGTSQALPTMVFSRLAPLQRLRALRAATAVSSPDRIISHPSLPSRDIVAQITAICGASEAPSFTLPFRLRIATSTVPNAGLGVFVAPNPATEPPFVVRKHTVVALYPGVVYAPGDPLFFASLRNRYVLQRIDGSFVDGKHNGLSRSLYRSIWARGGRIHDAGWLSLRREGTVESWNVGQLVNNCTGSGADANVMYNEFTLDSTFPDEFRRFIPNVPYSPEEFEVHGIALVATKDISFKSPDHAVELLASYQSLAQ
ncbi:hypothetical protein BC830DRAFT_1163874 [Chytriomyces sp. MP71]|nr:hypothetical protein BC830DRAFT_1163874 [Chytriomyces sp. MP71]